MAEAEAIPRSAPWVQDPRACGEVYVLKQNVYLKIITRIGDWLGQRVAAQPGRSFVVSAASLSVP
jgi:hypothetical protein